MNGTYSPSCALCETESFGVFSKCADTRAKLPQESGDVAELDALGLGLRAELYKWKTDLPV